MQKNILFLKFSIIIIAILLISWLIYLNASPNIELPSRDYQFHVYLTSDKGYTRDFQFNYDFESQKGNLSFRFYGWQQNTGIFILNVPKELNIFDYSLITDNGLNIVNTSSCYLSMGDLHGIKCDNITNNDTVNVLLNVKDNGFYPNGLFAFHFSNDDNSLKQDIDTYSYDLLRFNFGNKYRCSEKCFTYEYGNPNFIYNSNKGFFRVYFLPEANGKIGRDSRFIINTYNFEKEKNSAFFLAIGISLGSGLVFFVLNLFEMKKLMKRINGLIVKIKREMTKISEYWKFIN